MHTISHKSQYFTFSLVAFLFFFLFKFSIYWRSERYHSIYWSLEIWKAPIIELYCPLTPFTLYPQWQYTYVNFIKHTSNFNIPHMGLVKATFKSQSHKIVGSTLIYVYQKSWYFELSNNYYCILIQWSMAQEWSVLTLSAMQCKTVVFWGKLNISWTEPYYDFA